MRHTRRGAAVVVLTLVSVHAQVQELGVPVAGGPGAVGAATPWLLVEGLTAETAQLQQENWFGALQEVALDSSSGGGGGAYDAARFLQLAEVRLVLGGRGKGGRRVAGRRDAHGVCGSWWPSAAAPLALRRSLSTPRSGAR